MDYTTSLYRRRIVEDENRLSVIYSDGTERISQKEADATLVTQLKELGVKIRHEELAPHQLRARFEAGAVPLALLSSWQIYEAKVPHWVVISGFDDHFVYVNDPFVDDEKGETELDSINMPIANDTFHHIARYGRRALRAIVLVSKPK